MCRWFHPAPPSKATVKAERTFEGISLDIPGQSAKTVTSMSSRFQLCPACYQLESRCGLHFRCLRCRGGKLLMSLAASYMALHDVFIVP